MGCEFICDGCGKRAPAVPSVFDWLKPRDWYQRSDEAGPQDACCRECIDRKASAINKIMQQEQ